VDRYERRLRIAAVAGDLAAVVGAYTVAAGARFGFDVLWPQAGLWPVYPIMSAGVAGLTVALAWQLGAYRYWALFGGHRVYPILITVATYGVVAVVVLSYFVGGPPLVSRGWLVASWVGAIVALSGYRLLLRRVAIHWRVQGRLTRKVLIAGANRQGMAVAEQLNDPARHGTSVLGFLDDYQRPGTEVLPGLYVVGHPTAVLEHAGALGASEVIIIPGALAWDSQRLLAEMVTRPDSPLQARIAPTFYDLLTTSAELNHIAYVPMLTLHQTRLSGLNAWLKVVFDRVTAATLLAALFPAWVLWRLRSWMRGVPMLVTTEAIGLKGRRFRLFGLNPELVRSAELARLPALWNVAWQDMSFVGPRPLRAEEVEVYERWLANLFAMRPGLTGLWRLRGGALSVEQGVALDLYYIRNYSITLDAQVLFTTARRLARRSLGWESDLARWQRGRVAASSAVQPTGGRAQRGSDLPADAEVPGRESTEVIR
jgi:lipopolysaccharide/colanic/teichoic acid biosynthesis glycosyltransferase